MQMWKKETFPEISINCYNNPPATLPIQDCFYWLEAREVVYVTCGMGASRESGTRPILQKKSCLLRKVKFSHKIGHISCAL